MSRSAKIVCTCRLDGCMCQHLSATAHQNRIARLKYKVQSSVCCVKSQTGARRVQLILLDELVDEDEEGHHVTVQLRCKWETKLLPSASSAGRVGWIV